MAGTNEAIIQNTVTLGYIMTYKNIDTNPGNSGSPIYAIDENFVNGKKQGKYFESDTNRKKCMIGIHTGHNPGLDYNFGTLITPEVFNWISYIVEEYI